MEYVLLIVGAVLVNNFVLSRFLGICPFLGVSKKIPTAMGMGGALILVMTVGSGVTWLLNKHLLDKHIIWGVKIDLWFMQTIVYILVIASFVQALDITMKKTMPALHGALGIYLPLITTNCAVLGVALLNVQLGYNFWEAVLYGFSAAVGFTLALLIFSGLREKIDRANPPAAFKGVAIALVTAGVLSLAFMGFSGLVK